MPCYTINTLAFKDHTLLKAVLRGLGLSEDLVQGKGLVTNSIPQRTLGQIRKRYLAAVAVKAAPGYTVKKSVLKEDGSIEMELEK